MNMHRSYKCLAVSIATLFLAAQSALSADDRVVDRYADRYLTEDPFREADRVDNLREFGWDLSKELVLEFEITFSGEARYRAGNAKAFAFKLAPLGFKADAQACPNSAVCWRVVATKSVRPDLKRLIVQGKELDQLAADHGGRYQGWDCEILRNGWEKRYELTGR